MNSSASVQLYDWQEPSAALVQASLVKYGVMADGSEMGTGKTIKTIVVAKRLQKPIFVVCPKAVVLDWQEWAGRVGVPCTAVSYETLRTGKTPHGRWAAHTTKTVTVKGQKKTKKVPVLFEFTLPKNALLVFDEAHKLSGLDTQQSRLLIAAKNQGYMTLLLSGTLFDSPLKCRAAGYALGCHNLLNFWQWAKKYGVREGMFGMVFKPKNETTEEAMARLRLSLGDKFTRVRKSDVPGFPDKQIVPVYAPTIEMPDDETLDGGRYGYEARMHVELLKVPSLVYRANDLLEEGHSVTIFVNYSDTLNALREEFPDAAIVCGGQSSTERKSNIDRFQHNHTHVALVMIQAGGTGTNFHDLHGRPRSSLICPGNNPVDFLQAIDRIHRTGALSPATIYVVYAAGVPVERRMRHMLEQKLGNLSALNDTDFDPPPVTNSNKQKHNAATYAAHSSGALPPNPGATQQESPALPHQCPVVGTGLQIGFGGTPDHPPVHGPGSGASSGHCDAHGPHAGLLGPGPKPGSVFCGPGNPTSDVFCGPGPAVAGVQAVHHSPESHGASPDCTTRGSGSKVVKILMPVDAPAPAPATLAQRIEAKVEAAHGERKHARCSPSKLKNLAICPSYEPDNDREVHPVTLRGTAMHEAMETINDALLDDEETRLVNLCREFLAEEIASAETVIDEQHLKTHDKDVQGFVDKLMIYAKDPVTGRRKAKIRDYKFGWNPVDSPENNSQAIAYTLACFLQWEDVDEVDFAFLIPRLDMVLQHTFTRADVPALKMHVTLIAERVRKLAGKEFNPNLDNCFYCGRKATCEPCINKSLSIARAQPAEHGLTLPAELNPTLLNDPKQIAYGLNVASVLEDWIVQMRKHALRFRQEIGQEVPGYDYIERSAKREVANPVGAWDILSKEFGVTQEEFFSACKVSITQLEKVVKDHAERGQKDKAAEAFTDRLLDEGYLTRGGSFYVLQRAKKKKPEKTVTDAGA